MRFSKEKYVVKRNKSLTKFANVPNDMTMSVPGPVIGAL